MLMSYIEKGSTYTQILLSRLITTGFAQRDCLCGAMFVFGSGGSFCVH